MAAPTLETNAAADTLRIMGGNAGNPVTWDDVWNWDDGGGSSGGAGDVPKDGGGTARVDTFMTEIVARAIYLILKHVDFGDGIAPTYFQSIREFVNMPAHTPLVKANATLVIGEPSNEYSADPVSWRFKGNFNDRPFSLNGNIELYNASIYIYSNWTIVQGGTLKIRRLSVSGQPGVNYFLVDSCTYDVDDLYASRLGVSFRGGTNNGSIGLHNENAGIGFYTRVSHNVYIGALATNCTIDIRTHQVNTTMIDPLFHPATLEINFNGNWVKEQYTCNIHIVDKDGIALGTVIVNCEDQFGNPVWAAGTIATNGAGDIAEQIITYKRWIDIAKTLTTYSPHKFTISKAGYETMELDDVTVDAPIVWHLELLPALAEADVRDGTNFGEDKTGSLDLPAITDVEKGVQFDNLTKTGTFKSPAEADVRDGEGYGAGDVEFAGSLDLPSINDVEDGVFFDSGTKEGNFEPPSEDDVEDGVGYGSLGTEFEGNLEIPIIGDVRDGIGYGSNGTEFEGVLDLPSINDVEDGVFFDNTTKEGNFEAPSEDDVEDGVGYGSLGTEFEGNFESPAEGVVMVGVGYGANGTEFLGTYAILRGTNLTAVLEESVSLTGELKS
jgi:hypothetical protein